MKRSFFRTAAFALAVLILLPAAPAVSARGEPVLRSCATTVIMGPSVQQGSLYFQNGGSVNIPDGFTDTSSAGPHALNGVYYEFYNGEQNMVIRISEIPTSSFAGGTDALTVEYNSLIETLPSPTYNVKNRSSFVLSGYSGPNIYYIYEEVSHSVVYTVEFVYPTANRYVCDSILETVIASLSTAGGSVVVSGGGSAQKPGPYDLDAIHSDIRYPNNDWMYLDNYIYATVIRDACWCFKDPDSDVWREGNYFKVYRGTEVKIIAEGSGYACVILTGTNLSGWINTAHLSNS
ncbi:MAG: hypothetical protein K6C08_13130 [Oscillospiraceae bacterium]|nr:hypothetical protein [Oscillospiraceae bacterium]